MYLVLIRAAETDIYAISVAHNLEMAVKSLRDYSPLPCALEHSIHAGSRTEYLERTLQIKFRAKLSHSFWYRLAPEDVEFIKSLTDSNFARIAGFLNKQAAPAPAGPAPAIAPDALPDFITQQMELAERLLK